eukprot:376768-Amphidinium_carterae.1
MVCARGACVNTAHNGIGMFEFVLRTPMVVWSDKLREASSGETYVSPGTVLPGGQVRSALRHRSMQKRIGRGAREQEDGSSCDSDVFFRKFRVKQHSKHDHNEVQT